MDFKKVKDKWMVFLFAAYAAIAIAGLIIFMINENFIELDYFYVVYLIPIISVILHNVDIKNKEVIDEYIFTIISGSLFGITLADYVDLIGSIVSIGFIPYFIMIVYYLLLMAMVNNILKNILKNRKV